MCCNSLHVGNINSESFPLHLVKESRTNGSFSCKEYNPFCSQISIFKKCFTKKNIENIIFSVCKVQSKVYACSEKARIISQYFCFSFSQKQHGIFFKLSKIIQPQKRCGKYLTKNDVSRRF